jgi:hypothetical protein
MTPRRLVLYTILCALVFAIIAAAQQDDQDNYFAGTVVETAKDHLKVSRVLQGKTEQRVFRVTPDTKVEGNLRNRVRVTVRFTSDGDSYTAVLVLVRTTGKQKKN